MRNLLGLCLVLVGLGIGIHSYVGWENEKTAAQDLTTEDLKEFEQREVASDAAYTPLPPTTLSDLPDPVITSKTAHTLGDEAATLMIPDIDQKFSVYWGTNDSVLSQGVGLYVSDYTTVPGGNGHTVMSGHRDTVFTRLGELEVSDLLLVEYDDQKFSYEITDIWITDKDDRTVITTKEESILTLTTCYPFDFFGDAPDRYIIQAKMIERQ